jgi:hypothetical protein
MALQPMMRERFSHLARENTDPSPRDGWFSRAS